MRLKESTPAKQDRGHGTRQFPAANGTPPEVAEACTAFIETSGGKNRLAHDACLCLFLVQFAVVWVRLWAAPSSGFWHGHWPEAILLITAMAATLSSLARELPLQNVLLADGLLALAGLGVESLNTAFGVPFGRIRFSPSAGPLLFNQLPWCIPFLWVTILLNARGVARFLLAPARTNPNYGLYVLALTVVLVSAFQVSFQSFAVRIDHYWDWGSGPLFPGWVETPGVELLSRAVTTLVIIALVTPILLDKKPTPRRPLAFPLVLWLLMLLFVLTAAEVNRLWPIFAIALIHMVLIAALAWYRFRSATAQIK